MANCPHPPRRRPFAAARLTAVLAVAVAALPAEPAPATGGERVPLTDDELAWIAAHPVIRAGHDTGFVPYAMQDAAGNLVGIDPDYLDLISRRTGLKFENVAGKDWGRMLEDFKQGRLDVLPSLNRDPAREAYLLYTAAYASAYNVIITRSDEPYVSTLADVRGHTLGITAGGPELPPELDPGAPRNKLIIFDSAADCYKAVARGDVYACVGEVASASYFISSHRLTNLRLGGVVSTSPELHLGVRQDWPMLVQILNKGISTLSASDRQRIAHRWIAADTTAGLRWARAFRIAAVVAGVAIILILLALFHTRRLARELAERRRIQAELERTRDHLLQANREKSELVHMVAHDLRSPLTAILLGLDLLQHDPPLPAPTLHLTARSINRSADVMARLINDLLSTQNLEEGRRSLKFAAGDAAQLARASVAGMYAHAAHKEITVEAVVPPEPLPLTTDFVALQQVVDNLLSNAIKYSPRGARVQVAVKADGGHCRFEVRDEGPGVDERERERIFEKFRRGAAQPTQGESSTGLGLWIVRRFTQALYGRVWCEPGPEDIGSVFVVEVPATPPVI